MKITILTLAALCAGMVFGGEGKTLAGLERLGVAYYPEVWSRADWQHDLKLMKECGFNAVRIGEFNWSKFEPQEGVFDFSEYREFLALCAQEGIQVVMCTPTAALPPWMHHRFPDTEKTVEGKLNSLGGRQTYCPSSKKLREFSARIVRRMAEAFRDCPAIVSWQLDNELNVHGGTGICHCRECSEGFREFLKRRYGTIEKFNRELNTAMWGAQFSCWDEIFAPFGHRAAWSREYCDYLGEAYFGLVLEQAKILRAVNPKWTITSNNPEASGTARYDRLYRELDYAACDTYMNAPSFDCRGVPSVERVRWMWNVFRGMRGRQAPFTVAETAPNNFTAATVDGDKAVRCFFWDAIFHGADSFFYFRWRMSVIGEDTHPAVLGWSGKPSHTYRRLKAQFAEARKAGPIAAAPMPPTEVAILHDPFSDQYLLAGIRELQGGNLENTSIRLNAALERLGLKPDILQMECTPDFTPYKLVFLPVCARLPKAIVAKLTEYVRNGGKVVAITRLNDLTEFGAYVKSPYPVGLTEVFGLEVNERRELEGACGYAEYLELKGAEAVKRFATTCFAGEPLLTRNRFGKGLALWLATLPTNESALVEVGEILKAAGIDHREPLPADVSVLTRGEFTACINFNGVANTVPLPAGSRVLGEGEAANGKLTLPPWGVAIYQCNR